MKNANLSENILKLIHFLVDLLLQVIVKREISWNIVMLNFYHFLNHKCVVFLFVSVPFDLDVKNSVIHFFFLTRSNF